MMASFKPFVLCHLPRKVVTFSKDHAWSIYWHPAENNGIKTGEENWQWMELRSGDNKGANLGLSPCVFLVTSTIGLSEKKGSRESE